MLVNLDINNRKKVIEYKCKKIACELEIRYIDIDTGKLIQTESIKDLQIGEHEVNPLVLDSLGYEVVEGFEILDNDSNDKEMISENKEKTYVDKDSPYYDTTLDEMLKFADMLGSGKNEND